MTLNDFNERIKDTITPIETALEESITDDHIDTTPMPKLDEHFKKMQESAQPEKKREPITQDATINYLDINQQRIKNSEWKDKQSIISSNINTISKTVQVLNGIVKQYQDAPEEITEEVTNKFKQQLVVLNGLFQTQYTINSESSFESYVVMMKELVSKVADNIDSVRSELITELTQLQEEFNGCNLEVDRLRIETAWKKLASEPTKILNVIDYTLDAVLSLEERTPDTVKAFIKKNEKFYVISLKEENDTGLNADYTLTAQELEDLTKILLEYCNTYIRNFRYLDNSPESNIGTLLGIYTKLLKSNTIDIYKTLITLASTAYEGSSDIGYVNQGINKYSIDFLQSLGFLPSEQDNWKALSRSGVYSIDNGKIVNIPNTTVRPFTLNTQYTLDTMGAVYSVLDGLNITTKTLNVLPSKLIKILKLEAFSPKDTTTLVNQTIALGSILTISNLYREITIYNILQRLKSFSILLNSYYITSERLSNLYSSKGYVVNAETK